MAVTYSHDPAPIVTLPLDEWGPVKALSQTAFAGSRSFASGRWKMVGFNVAESSGTNPARVRVWDADSAGNLNLLVASASVVANASTQPGGMGEGLLIETGIWVQVVSGAADVTVYARHRK